MCLVGGIVVGVGGGDVLTKRMEDAGQVVAALSGSVSFRDKSLKILQTLCKLIVRQIHALRWGSLALFGERLDGTAQACSTGRRMFALLRWLRYSVDLRAAGREPNPQERVLTQVEVLTALAADIIQDITTLEKVGIIPKGSVPKWLERIAPQLDLLFTAVVLVNGSMRLARAYDEYGISAAGGATASARKHKLAMQQLALLKYTIDFCLACKGAGVLDSLTATQADLGALVSTAISVHKEVDKAAC